MNFAPTPSSVRRRCEVRRSRIGRDCSLWRSRASSKAGDSDTLSRTQSPTPMTTALSRNGMRQPQAVNVASDIVDVSSANSPAGSRRASRRAELRRGCRRSPALGRRRLAGEQHGAALFAADAEALHEPERDEQDRGPDADRLVGRHEPDQERAEAGHDDRDHEHPLAAEAIAEVPETRPPSGRARKATATSRTPRASPPADPRSGRRAVEQQRRSRAVDEEVVALQDRAERRRERRPPDPLSRCHLRPPARYCHTSM